MTSPDEYAQMAELVVVEKRVDQAIEMAIQFGGIDGSHHKAWVIDQMLRILADKDYDELIRESCDGADGPETYIHDVGIPP